jgi:hypothetical protein
MPEINNKSIDVFDLSNLGLPFSGLIRLIPDFVEHGRSCDGCCGIGEYQILEFSEGLPVKSYIKQGSNYYELPLSIPPGNYKIQYMPGVTINRESCKALCVSGSVSVPDVKLIDWIDVHELIKPLAINLAEEVRLLKISLDLVNADLVSLQKRYDELYDECNKKSGSVDVDPLQSIIDDVLKNAC